MSSVRVKICGITSPDDALEAVEAGADALGFVFYDRSPRQVTLGQAATIIRRLPPLVAKVGVFVNPAAAWVRRAIAESGLDTLQFHGEESSDFCVQFGLKAIKAFRVSEAASLPTLLSYATDAWLLDSYVAGQHGGTGERFNWNLAIEAKAHGRPLILAGGLTPANVAEAVRRVRPFAVDVSTGVERAPGEKDADKMRAFVAAAKTAT
ncbi:MAG: phosphoribosylanthranilate isomerase [Verrucomicrobia bacterium]|nr:phosphoribosylanthranilate isomerase [Verrucomicrobiota bacterium]